MLSIIEINQDNAVFYMLKCEINVNRIIYFNNIRKTLISVIVFVDKQIMMKILIKIYKININNVDINFLYIIILREMI